MAAKIGEPSSGLVSRLHRLYSHFPPRRRRQLALLLPLMLLGATAELVTLGAALPFISFIAGPKVISSYPILQSFFSKFGWTEPHQIITAVTLLFAAVVLGAAAVRLLLTWATQRFVYRLGHDLSVEAYRRTLYQPYPYHVAKNTSELIGAISKVDVVAGGILLPLMQSLIGALISAFILAALFTIDAKIALSSALAFGAMYIAVSYAIRRPLARNSDVIARVWTSRIQAVQEGLGAIRDVLIDHAQPVYLDKLARVDTKYRDAEAMNLFAGAAPRLVIEACGMIVIALLALSLSREPGGLVAALPVLGALALGAQRLLPLLQLVYSGWTQCTGNAQVLSDVLAILDLPTPEISSARKSALLVPFEREISLEAVTFSYNDRQPGVLENVTLRIGKGSRIGFIGKTGSGKSTLIDIIMGLLRPTAGDIKVDGRPLDEQTVYSWQAKIAHVPQAIYLADASIAENIAFCIPQSDIDMGLVVEAAKKARLNEFIASLPCGYYSAVGERGVRLSGGQRQRIGIARALYKQAKLLVFDEATSALDSETEAAVMTAIQSLGPDLTILIVAHRLSTLALCDKIVELDSGRIVAEGPTKDILRKHGMVMSTPEARSPVF